MSNEHQFFSSLCPIIIISNDHHPQYSTRSPREDAGFFILLLLYHRSRMAEDDFIDLRIAVVGNVDAGLITSRKPFQRSLLPSNTHTHTHLLARSLTYSSLHLYFICFPSFFEDENNVMDTAYILLTSFLFCCHVLFRKKYHVGGSYTWWP